MSIHASESAGSDHWHRQFAAECNNRAWELAVQARTSSEDREMLDAAHASAWHWGKVGGELNVMRAVMLLAEVHAVLGNGAIALSLAEKMRDYFLSCGSPDWEIAFAHTIHAHAAHAAGRFEQYRAAYREAEAALRGIADEQDRLIVAKTFSCVPRP